MIALLTMLFLAIQCWNSGQLLINQNSFACYEGWTCFQETIKLICMHKHTAL